MEQDNCPVQLNPTTIHGSGTCRHERKEKELREARTCRVVEGIGKRKLVLK